MSTLKAGAKRIFRYPAEFVTLPDYSAHRGQEVKIVRELDEALEYDGPGCGLERMYRVEAADGWQGDAFESELAP